MEYRKKVLIIILLMILLVVLITFISFSKANNNFVNMSKSYMNKYKRLDSSVTDNISYDFSDKLSTSQEKTYINIIKKQYKSMDYEIEEKDATDTSAIVKVKIKVCDLRSTIDKANAYISLHKGEFYDSGKYSDSLAVDYKLDMLNNCADNISYSITLNYYKSNGKWVMKDLSENDLKKVRGTY